MIRSVPAFIEGYGPVEPFAGAFARLGPATRRAVTRQAVRPGQTKLLPSIRAAIEACGLKDGATVSFHHHLRNGDDVLRAVMEEIAAMGFRDITVAATSLFPVHAPLADHIRNGVVSGISATYIRGPVADAIAAGALPTPAVLLTHGGRARALEAGDIRIDVAFVAAPTADSYGNINGVQGKSACGTLGYPMVDARCADRVVAITDHLVPYPACPIDISQEDVDFVVAIDSIGDPQRIVSGITRVTTKPEGKAIAAMAAAVIDASGLLKDGFSFQMGAGGVSLAVADTLKTIMTERGIVGSFAAGGITGTLVDMLEAGLFRTLFDVQCFDLKAVDSYRRNLAHQSMSASQYGNPHTCGAVVNQLDAMMLGAAEVDLDFNVNVTLGNNGVILGGSGGHSDTAAGAKLALVTTSLATNAHPKIVERVSFVTTPGDTIDAVVTEAGIAVNPRRSDLQERLRDAGLPVVSIEELQHKAAQREGVTPPPPVNPAEGRILAVGQYRDGTVIDVIRANPG